MASREELLIEANRRGLLTGQDKALFDEAVNRGLIEPPAAPPNNIDPRLMAGLDPRLLSTPPEDAGVGNFALRQFIDNFLNVDRATGTILADAAAGARTAAGTVPRLVQGQPLEVGRRFDEARQDERSRFPANVLREGIIPDTFDIEAAGRTAGNVIEGEVVSRNPNAIQDRFRQNRDQLVEDELRTREESPVASTAGDLLGDAATLLTGRVPLARAARNRRFAARGAGDEVADVVTTPPKGLEALRLTADDIVQSKLVRNLRRGGLRIGEATLEGAVIGALSDEDPLTSAAMAAGAQTAGSTLLGISDGLLKKGGRNLLFGIAGTVAFIQLFKSATPGGRDRILESTESGFNKVAATLALGGLAGAAGMGRVGGRLSDRLPGFADSITTLPRGSVISLLSDIGRGDANAQLTEQVIFKLAEDPEFFGPAAARRIERALYSENISVTETINDLRADRQFRRRLEEL